MKWEEAVRVVIPLLQTVWRDDPANSPIPRGVVNKMIFKGTDIFLMIVVVHSEIKYVIFKNTANASKPCVPVRSHLPVRIRLHPLCPALPCPALGRGGSFVVCPLLGWGQQGLQLKTCRAEERGRGIWHHPP